MNVDNLQLEGLMTAVASINYLLVQKGLLSVDDIDIAFAEVRSQCHGR